MPRLPQRLTGWVAGCRHPILIAARRLSFCAALIILPHVSVQAIDWFRWRGPDLNGISRESAWSTDWPAEGPKQLWKASVGIGFSSVSVSQGRVYTMGNAEGLDTVFCFQAESGAMIWKHSYPCGLRPQYYEGGTSVTPTVDDDRLYTLSKEGDLFCLESKTGQVQWQLNLVTNTGAVMPRWGFGGSPLVMDKLLVLNAGAHGMALDKVTGKPVWTSGGAAAGYATPVPISFGDRQCVLIFGAKALACVDLQDGHELWRYPWITKWDLNIADPIVDGDQVFISSFDRGAALLKVDAQGAAPVWANKNMANHFSTSVLFKGALYGIHGNTDTPPADLRCVDLKTGEIRWRKAGLGFGSLMLADGKLLMISDKGELVVSTAVPESFLTVARAQVLGGKCWITPVLSNGRIYCRNAQGTLVCLDASTSAAH